MKTISFLILFSVLTATAKECNTDKNMDEITVKTGETFEIVLRASPSTGYEWQWVEKESASLVDSLSVNYVPDTENLPGSPGNQTWKFKALEKGKAAIKFVYKRGWEDKSDDEESREFKVIIKDE